MPRLHLGHPLTEGDHECYRGKMSYASSIATLPDLRDELKTMGAPRVLSVVILSEDWLGVDRLGDGSLSVCGSCMAQEIGRGEDHDVPRAARQMELAEWVDALQVNSDYTQDGPRT